MIRVALLQLSSTDDPVKNLDVTRPMIDRAVAQGAEFVLTPEVTNCVSSSRLRQMDVLQTETEDLTLQALRDQAASLGIWLSIGSLALKTDDADGRFANRSFLISPEGEIAAWYDKIHMFDVTLSETESYRESSGYRPGRRAVVVDTAFAKIGLTICYDLRFPHLFRSLAKAGAAIITVPSAFARPTGMAHWEPLLRARAIETGCFVLAAAQTGTHPAASGKPRQTYGHSMAIAPWGEVLCDAGQEPGIHCVDLDLDEIARARQRVPSLTHDRPFRLIE